MMGLRDKIVPVLVYTEKGICKKKNVYWSLNKLYLLGMGLLLGEEDATAAVCVILCSVKQSAKYSSVHNGKGTTKLLRILRFLTFSDALQCL